MERTPSQGQFSTCTSEAFELCRPFVDLAYSSPRCTIANVPANTRERLYTAGHGVPACRHYAGVARYSDAKGALHLDWQS